MFHYGVINTFGILLPFLSSAEVVQQLSPASSLPYGPVYVAVVPPVTVHPPGRPYGGLRSDGGGDPAPVLDGVAGHRHLAHHFPHRPLCPGGSNFRGRHAFAIGLRLETWNLIRFGICFFFLGLFTFLEVIKGRDMTSPQACCTGTGIHHEQSIPQVNATVHPLYSISSM